MSYVRAALAAFLRDLLAPPPRPAAPAPLQIGDRFMALRYRVTFGAPKAPDVVERELVVTEGGADQPVIVVPVATPTAEFVVADGAAVSVKTRDRDDAGNYSEYSEAFAFTAADTLPPGTPDAPAVALVGEE